jgi:hypothetical protein
MGATMNKSVADRPRTSFSVQAAVRHGSRFLPHLRNVIAAILVMYSWPPQGALAEIFNLIGDHGDHQAAQPDFCKDNHDNHSFLIGLRVRVGDWMDELAIICGDLDSSGNVTGRWVGPARGGSGGAAPVDVTCGPNEIMNGVAFLFTPDNRQVRLLSFNCISMKTAGAHHDLSIGNTSHGPPTRTRQDCRPDEAINGLKVNWGLHVNAVGIACASKPYMAPPPRP